MPSDIKTTAINVASAGVPAYIGYYYVPQYLPSLNLPPIAYAAVLGYVGYMYLPSHLAGMVCNCRAKR